MTQLRIEGMTCQHCVKAVTEALLAVPGVTSVDSVSLETGLALIQEGTASTEALIAAVKDAGYGAREA